MLFSHCSVAPLISVQVAASTATAATPNRNPNLISCLGISVLEEATDHTAERIWSGQRRNIRMLETWRTQENNDNADESDS
jgi:hypothetical protein